MKEKKKLQSTLACGQKAQNFSFPDIYKELTFITYIMIMRFKCTQNINIYFTASSGRQEKHERRVDDLIYVYEHTFNVVQQRS